MKEPPTPLYTVKLRNFESFLSVFVARVTQIEPFLNLFPSISAREGGRAAIIYRTQLAFHAEVSVFAGPV